VTPSSSNLSWRFASTGDLPLLGELNLQLIADEGHRNPMNVQQLEARMRVWLSAEYRAVLFSLESEVVAYVLFREHGPDAIHLRQFFVARTRRREGIGRKAIATFVNEIIPNQRVVLDVLVNNAVGRAFWHAVGFGDYSITLERLPKAFTFSASVRA